MIASFLPRVDNLLRGKGGLERNAARNVIAALGMVCLFGASYGALMGTFSGIAGERLWQILYSATKVPLLLLVTFTICLPSFFVLNTLAGLRADFGEAMNALIVTQAALTILLLSFAPYTVLWYASFADYNAAILFNAGIFAIASLTAQMLLRRSYGPLIQRHSRHRFMMWTWLFLYAFVGIQTSWVLRPFIGDPGQPIQFFRSGAWGNAYVEVARKIHETVFSD